MDAINNFPSLKEWTNNKINDLCECLAVFFNYLSINRPEFYQVLSVGDGAYSIYPIITSDMAIYLFEDILPCKQMITEKNISPIPIDIKNSIEKIILSKIENRSFIFKDNESVHLPGSKKTGKHSLTIDSTVYQLFWKYIISNINILVYNKTTDDEIRQGISELQKYALSIRNCSINYGFNSNIESCAFETIIYLLVTITDWLELDTIGRDEVDTIYKLIIPEDLREPIIEKEDPVYGEIISTTLTVKNLMYTPEAINMLTKIMIDINAYTNKKTFSSDESRILNRYMSLARRC